MRTGLIDAVQVICNNFDQSPEDVRFPQCWTEAVACAHGGTSAPPLGADACTVVWPAGSECQPAHGRCQRVIPQVPPPAQSEAAAVRPPPREIREAKVDIVRRREAPPHSGQRTSAIAG